MTEVMVGFREIEGEKEEKSEAAAEESLEALTRMADVD